MPKGIFGTPGYILKRNNVHVQGDPTAKETLVFCHGYGSEQSAWRFITPAFQDRYQLVLYDLTGCGASDLAAFDPHRYSRGAGYADDLITICDTLKLRRVHLVAHSVSGMIGSLAALQRPDLFASLVFVGTSPRYINDGDYTGGFTAAAIEELLATMQANYQAWAQGFAPFAMNQPDNPALGREFARSLATMRPDIAVVLARFIFNIDFRAEIARLRLPVTILQAQQDIVVPEAVGHYLHAQIANSELRWLTTTGHFPHMGKPEEVVEALRLHLARQAQN